MKLLAACLACFLVGFVVGPQIEKSLGDYLVEQHLVVLEALVDAREREVEAAEEYIERLEEALRLRRVRACTGEGV